MVDGTRRIEPDGPVDQLDGAGAVARLMAQHAQKMQRVGIVRRDLEHLRIERGGGIEAAQTMRGQRLGQHVDRTRDAQALPLWHPFGGRRRRG